MKPKTIAKDTTPSVNESRGLAPAVLPCGTRKFNVAPMALATFCAKTNYGLKDAVAVVRGNPFDAVRSVLATQRTYRVVFLLCALWLERARFSRFQLKEAILDALFGPHYPTISAVAAATDLARQMGCEAELRKPVQQRWPTLNPEQAVSFLFALDSFPNPEQWLEFLPVLFQLSQTDDVRARIVFHVKEWSRFKRFPTARPMLLEMLAGMPDRREAYVDPNNYQLIKGMKARRQRKKSNHL